MVQLKKIETKILSEKGKHKMLEISNLKKENRDGRCYLTCEFNVIGSKPLFEENTMWIAVDEKNEDMLSDNVYDPFVLVPVIIGMY